MNDTQLDGVDPMVSAESTEGGINTDFNLDEEYKEYPLIPVGMYQGEVANVSMDLEQMAIIWDLVIHAPDGVMSDGTTPIVGQHVMGKNWLPKPGDEDKMTTSGRTTKRQSKINSLKRFADKMQIDMTTPVKIATAIQEMEWIGIPVQFKVTIDSFEGNTFNKADRMTRMT